MTSSYFSFFGDSTPAPPGGPVILSSDLTGLSSDQDASFVRQSERTYLVFAPPDVDENQVRANFGIRIGDRHPSDGQQLCVGISARWTGRVTDPGSNDAAYRWECTARFGPWNLMENSPSGNPVNIPARFRFEITTVNQPAWEDVDENPIVNSAGDYFDPPVEREVKRVTVTVNRNESAPNPGVLLALANVINAAPWNGFPAKTVKLAAPKMPQIEYSQATGSFYWPMEYVFEYNPDTWTRRVPNRGYRRLDSAGKLVPILIDGQPLSDPMFLDEMGQPLLTPGYLDTTGGVPGDTSPGGYSGEVPGGGEPPNGGTGSSGTVIINAYDIYRTYDFSNFRMDNLFTLPAGLL